MPTILTALALVGGAFLITYTASRVAFLAKKPADMLWAIMLCAAGVIFPMAFAAAFAEALVAPAVVPVVILGAALASLGAHLFALRKLK